MAQDNTWHFINIIEGLILKNLDYSFKFQKQNVYLVSGELEKAGF